jgi:hypothetical protein
MTDPNETTTSKPSEPLAPGDIDHVMLSSPWHLFPQLPMDQIGTHVHDELRMDVTMLSVFTFPETKNTNHVGHSEP